MIVMAFDPGITTGYATGLIEDGAMTVLTGQEKYDHKDMYDCLVANNPDAIIYESFEFRRQTRTQEGLELFSREIIGVIELYAQQQTPQVPIYKQSPSQAMGFFTDDRLKKHLIYKMNRLHANDAARHLLQWFMFGSGFQYNKNGFTSGS